MPSLSHFISTAALAASLLSISANGQACPPLGPVLPAPTAPSHSHAIKAASKELEAAIKKEFTSKFNTSGLSIGVKSIHEQEQLFSYHFTPPHLSGIGTSSIDENTIYRVGSLSKIFPALAALQHPAISMEDSVVKYIPQLKNAVFKDEVESVAWEDVTVGAVASHIAGLVTDTATDLGLFPSDVWLEMGLPNTTHKGPSCSGLGGTPVCTKNDLVQEMSLVSPIYLPYTTPIYSNFGYAILGMVVEAATNMTFEDAVQEKIFDAVGMTSSSFNGFVKSFSKKGFVPEGETTWNYTLGAYESAGGMFSSTTDILAFGEAVLTNKFFSSARTRRWLKPATDTASWGMSVGQPWEILRTDNITSDGRAIDMYSKSGDLGLYHAMLVLIQDYDLVVSILSGGEESSPELVEMITSAVAAALVPAIEQAGKEEVSAKSTAITGSYRDESTNSTFVVSMDDGPGLVIKDFSVRGFDVYRFSSSYSTDALAAGGSLTPDEYVDARMYPTNRVSKYGNGGSQTAWRAYFDTTTPEEHSELGDALVTENGACDTWFMIDRSSYNFHSLWEFRVVKDAHGKVEAIRNEGFNISLTKTSTDC